VDKRFFKRIYRLSHKWRGLNQIVIKLEKYMKFYMNYVCIELIEMNISLITN